MSGVKPPVTMSFKKNGSSVDLSSKISGLTIDCPFNGRASASVQFQNYYEESDEKPFFVRPGEDLGLKHHNRLVIDNSIAANSPVSSTAADAIFISIEVLGQKSNLPVFLGGGWQSDYPTGNWPLYDFTYFLEPPNQFMDDIVDDDTEIVMAHAEVVATARKYGIVSTVIRFPDYRIRQLRRARGTPRGWIGKLCRPSQSAMRFEGSTLILEPFVKTLNPSWSFVAGVNIAEFSWSESEPPPPNRFVLSRLDPQKGIVGHQPCVGGPCVGRTVDIVINPPSRIVRAKYTVNSGVIENWVFVDISGFYHDNGNSGNYQGSLPAARVIATYRPQFNVTTNVVSNVLPGTYTPGYDITLTGGNVSATAIEAEPYKKEFNDLPSQTEYGVWPSDGNIEDPIIPDQATLTAYGNAVLLESVRHTYSATLTTHEVNPKIKPGQFVSVTAPLHGQSRWSKPTNLWFVENVRYIMQNQDWSMVLSLTKGLW